MNKTLLISVSDQPAAHLTEHDAGRSYTVEYLDGYAGRPVSLTLPVEGKVFVFDRFPPFFDGTLPEGYQLEALLKRAKLDRNDLMGQLLTVGNDLVGNVTVTMLNTGKH